MDRSTFTPHDTVEYIWKGLGLPIAALQSLDLIQNEDYYPSCFKVDHLAQSTIALSGLAAALFSSTWRASDMPKVSVANKHACVEFKSEKLYLLEGKPAPSSWGVLGGLHKAADGYVRMHDSFPNHRENALKLLGLKSTATRNDVARAISTWRAVELETKAFQSGCVIAALRSFAQWDEHPQSKAIADFPIDIRRISDAKPMLQSVQSEKRKGKCLHGIRVVEMSRVIAAPVAGKTLAAHGADVIWVTSPSLPDLPDVDVDLSRGKRSVQLDIKKPNDKEKLLELIRTADVFIQSYRPGSLAAHGLSPSELIATNPDLIVASLDAYGSVGPWSENRGFDSLVQTCSGINFADTERAETSEAVRVLPCQAFDHGAGYLLATGIMAGLYKRAVEGGAYEVNVSLAGAMKYLRSLGQYEGRTGYDRKDFNASSEVGEFLETRSTELGELRAVRHSVSVSGLEVGWEFMPKPLGSDEPKWL